jgi:hypothetical protein
VFQLGLGKPYGSETGFSFGKNSWGSDVAGPAKSGCSILRSRGHVYLTLTIVSESRVHYRASYSPRSQSAECMSERVLRVRARIHFAQEKRNAVRPSSSWDARGGSKKARTSFAGPKKGSGRRPRGEERDVTRRKKGARSKREAVNLGLLLGNRDSF